MNDSAKITQPQFSVVTDGGIDVLDSLQNNVPIAPLTINFGERKYQMYQMTREELFERIQTDPIHPHSMPPTLLDWADAYLRAGTENVLAISMSQGMSLSGDNAREARRLTDQNVRVFNSQTVSAAQAFQIHAACEAAKQGVSIHTTMRWLQVVQEETDLYFTLESLEYLRRGGRIGKVQAAIGELLHIKPIATIDKTTGTNTTSSRAFTFKRAKQALVDQVTKRYGEGTSVRVAILYGRELEDGEEVFELLKKRHPIIWHDFSGTNPMLSIHIGTRGAGFAVAPGKWPWERDEDLWWQKGGYLL